MKMERLKCFTCDTCNVVLDHGMKIEIKGKKRALHYCSPCFDKIADKMKSDDLAMIYVTQSCLDILMKLPGNDLSNRIIRLKKQNDELIETVKDEQNFKHDVKDQLKLSAGKMRAIKKYQERIMKYNDKIDDIIYSSQHDMDEEWRY